TQTLNGIQFRYHHKYINPQILDKKIFIRPGGTFSQNDYNQTLRQLNDLGIFKYVRIFIAIDPTDTLQHQLNCYILMDKSDKYTFSTNLEISGGDMYIIGTSANISVSDKNFLKGANLLTTTVSYGVELNQNDQPDVSYL